MMSTGYAPPAIPSLETGTPPKEWSESVLASNPASNTPATFSEVEVGADCPKIPEGQPRESEEQGKQFVPEQGIKDTVSLYLSPEERHLEKPHVSLSSIESRSTRPSEASGGVGAFPGNLSEPSVAPLPDERPEKAQESASPRQRRDTIKPPPLAGAEGHGVLETRELTISRDAALPKEQRPIFQPSDAPSKSTETKTAESSSPEVESQKGVSEAMGEQTQSEQRKPGSRAGGSEEDVEGSNLGSEVPVQGKGSSQEEEIKEGKHVPATFKPGYGGDYHPAQLHPPPPGASVAEFQSSFGSQREELEPPTTKTGKRGSVSAEKMPGFMTMVKGEMKILAGKVSGDERKVEEGKRIVHGEA